MDHKVFTVEGKRFKIKFFLHKKIKVWLIIKFKKSKSHLKNKFKMQMLQKQGVYKAKMFR